MGTQGFRIRRPSPSMIVALIALIVALAGTSLRRGQPAEGQRRRKQLKKNSVTKAKIRDNAVTRAKIAKNAVTRAEIHKNAITGEQDQGPLRSSARTSGSTSLGKVPEREPSPTPRTASPRSNRCTWSAPPASRDSPKAAGNIGLVAPDTLSQPVGFYKDHGGIVHLEGFAEAGTDGFIFTLPTGYRPQSGITQIFESGESLILIFGSNITIGGEDVSGKVLADEADRGPQRDLLPAGKLGPGRARARARATGPRRPSAGCGPRASRPGGRRSGGWPGWPDWPVNICQRERSGATGSATIRQLGAQTAR